MTKKYINLLLGSVLLLGYQQARAQLVIDGTNYSNFGYVSNYDTYTAVTAATGSLYEAGSGAIFDHSESDVNTLRVDNPYNANGTGGSTDNFNGPLGAAGVQGVSGSVAPNFSTLVLKNGTSSLFNITNTAGANVFTTADFQNGITTTVRANTATGALRFQSGATYTGGTTDAQHVNGYVGKVGNAAFIFPVGSGTDSRTLTIAAPTSATAVITTAYDGTNVENASSVLGPIVSVFTGGSWDWITGIPTDDDNLAVTVSIPDVTGFATAANLRLVGWNGTQWIDLSGSANASGVAEGSTLSGTIPAGVNITQIGIGSLAVMTPPVAGDDLSSGNTPGSNVVIDILANDALSNGAVPTPGEVTVDLDPATPGTQATLVVPGEGTWTYNPATGGLTFDPEPTFTGNPTPLTYTLTEIATGLTDGGTVTVTVTVTPLPVAGDDLSSGNTPGSNVVIDILANDALSNGAVPTPGEVTVDLDPATPGTQATLVVPGEGTWTYNPATGGLTFDPEPTFTGNPTPLTYTLTEIATGLTDNGTATVTYSALPVTLVSFSAKSEGQTAVLNWATTAETNSDRFEIQRSKNGKDWSRIGSKEASGESKVLKDYSYTDASPLKGNNYYRLKMIDKDATFAYSRIRSIEFEMNVRTVLYPNPTVDILTLDVDDINKIERVQLNDIKGSVVYDRVKTSSSDTLSVIEMKNFPSGVYVVRVTRTDGTIASVKVVKQ